MLLWLFQDTQGFVDVHAFFVNITLTCDYYPRYNVRLIFCFCAFFYFDWVSRQVLTPTDWPQIFWKVPQAFSTCISNCVMYFIVFLVVEIFYCWLGLLSVEIEIWFDFLFFFLGVWPVFMVLILYKSKRRWADLCKYGCTHRWRTLLSDFWGGFFFFLLSLFFLITQNQGINVLILQKWKRFLSSTSIYLNNFYN